MSVCALPHTQRNAQTLEQDRQHLLAVERLVLETICFNFTVRMPFPYVIKIGRSLGVSKKLTKFAWRLAVDRYVRFRLIFDAYEQGRAVVDTMCVYIYFFFQSHRTLATLQYPPHVIALGCLYLTGLLWSFERPLSTSTEPESEVDNLSGTGVTLSSSASTSSSSADIRAARQVVDTFRNGGEWEATYKACVEDLEGMCVFSSLLFSDYLI
jgi:CTD kinase subunit beta